MNNKSSLTYPYIFKFLVLLCLWVPYSLNAQSEWLGKWRSDPIKIDMESLVLEYDFKNDSTLNMSFITSEFQPTFGSYTARISTSGRYKAIGPVFIVSLNKGSIKVEIEKLNLLKASRDMGALRRQLEQKIKSNMKPLVELYDGIPMYYATHKDDPNTISFIYGDETDAMDIEYHRITQEETELDDSIESTPYNEAKIETIPKISYKESPIKENKESFLSRLFSEEGNKYAKLFIWLGLLIGYFILAFIVIFGIKYLFIKKINRNNSAIKSVRIRKTYFIFRFLVRIVVGVIGVIFLLIGLGIVIPNFGKAGSYIAISLICGGGAMLIRVFSTLSLPMNFMTLEKFKKKALPKDYALYLRGFNADDYSPSSEYDKLADAIENAKPWVNNVEEKKPEPDPNHDKLNEYNMAAAWERYLPIYSVGSPEELESPLGTTRIYLDNESWQKDVLYLMENARYIIINVHKNDNCIWEIEKCNTMFPNKTVYYVDFLGKLKKIKDKMGTQTPQCLDNCYNENSINIKLIDKLIEEADNNNLESLNKLFIHLFVYQYQDFTEIKPYKNTIQGFSETVSNVFKLRNDSDQQSEKKE